MVVDKHILDELSERAKENSKLRQAMDLQNSPEYLILNMWLWKSKNLSFSIRLL